MKVGDKYYCPCCGAEYQLEEWDRNEIEDVGKSVVKCYGCDRWFMLRDDGDGKLYTHC